MMVPRRPRAGGVSPQRQRGGAADQRDPGPRTRHASIRQAIDAMAAAIANGGQTSHHDVAFHRAVLRATRNPMTIRAGDRLLERYVAASIRVCPSQRCAAISHWPDGIASAPAG